MLNELASTATENAVSKGFYEVERNIPEALCLIHSEVSEALEADRADNYFKGDIKSILLLNRDEFINVFQKDVKNTFEDELCDVIIRVLDLAGSLKIDLDSHIKAKMQYNASREHKHGKRY